MVLMAKTIDILGLTYRVVQEADPRDDWRHVWGLIDYENLIIHVKKDLPRDYKEDTLMHEIMHGVLERLHYIDQTRDEDYVTRLGMGIYQTLKPYLDFSKVLP
jgi:hypothetical protein